MVLLNVELGLGISIVAQRSACDLKPHAKALNITQSSERLGKMRISIIRKPGGPKVLARNLAERPARVLYLNSVIKPRDPHRRV